MSMPRACFKNASIPSRKTGGQKPERVVGAIFAGSKEPAPQTKVRGFHNSEPRPIFETRSKYKAASLYILLALLFLTATAVAQTDDDQPERILAFDSRINLNADGSMQVQETIEVFATGDKIEHGIYRDFPTRYNDRLGNHYSVSFAVVSVQRDGGAEPYHTESLSNGARVYFGDKNTLVSHGIHRYVFTYITNRQLGFFSDHDELYWNVNGVGWDFPIDVTTATVVLPPQIQNFATRLYAYAGEKGDKGHAVTSHDQEGNPQFRAEGFLPHENLAIVVAWQKGLIAEPTREQKIRWFLSDNRNTAIGLAGLVVVLAYYLVVWLKVGRDPKPGTIVPLYEPPDNMSPAAMRYLENMGFDDKTFTSAILGLAAKGHLKIEQDHASYCLIQNSGAAKAAPLSADEITLKRKLFEKDKTVRLASTSSAVIRAALDGLSTSLHKGMEKVYFVTNANYLWPGMVLTVIFALAMVVTTGGGQLPIAIFITIWLSGWSVGVGALLHAVARAWKSARAGGVLGRTGAMGITLFSIPFMIGELVGLGLLAWTVSVAGCLVILLLIGSNALFHYLLKAPTSAGRRLLDRVEGFKLFLSEVDGHRLNTMASPGKTPELFERFLPYALALGVEQAWAEQFSQVLAAAAGVVGQQSMNYSPSWYSGSFAASSPVAFASSFSSSFGSAVSSSSSPPGSSSGSGGGGSSGGGGGGGGGGGW